MRLLNAKKARTQTEFIDVVHRNFEEIEKKLRKLEKIFNFDIEQPTEELNAPVPDHKHTAEDGQGGQINYNNLLGRPDVALRNQDPHFAQNVSLAGKTLRIDENTLDLNSVSQVMFGQEHTINPLVKVSNVNGAGGATLLEKCHAVDSTADNYVVAVSRGNDNALTTWEMTKSVISIHKGVVRGAGAPTYMDDGVVCYKSGNYVAYAAYLDDALVIIDVTDITQPEVIGVAQGASGTNGNYLWRPHSVYIFEGRAYVIAGYDAALSIYDISDPQSENWMKLLGYIKGKHGENGLYLYAASDLWVRRVGDKVYCYVVSRQDGGIGTDENKAGALSIFDVTDPANIVQTDVIKSSEAPYDQPNSYELEGALGIVVDGNYAYVATRWQDRSIQTYDSGYAVGSVTIFDISDVTNIQHVGEIHGRGSGPASGGYPNGIYLGEAHWLCKKGNYVFVSAFTDDCITCIDVSNPSNPTQVSHAGSATDYCDGPVGCKVEGNYLYVAAYWSNAFLIFDISDVNNIVRVGGKTGAGYPYYLEGAHGICVENGIVYVSSRKADDALSIFQTEDGVRIASTPTGSYQNSGMLDPVDVDVAGDYAYVPARNSNRVLKINISNKASPYNAGSISGAGSPNYLGGCSAIKKVGNYLYVASYSDNAFVILNDNAGDSNPTLAGVISGGANHLTGALGLDVVGDRAYVCAYSDDALTVIDISNKNSPQYINHVAGAGEPYYLDGPRRVVVIGNYAYVVCTGEDAVVIYDISSVDSSNKPRLVKVIQGAGAPNYLNGGYGITSDGTSKIFVSALYDDAVNYLNGDNLESPIRESYIMGAGSPNYLDGPTYLKVCSLYGKDYVVVPTYDDNGITVLKLSEFTTKSGVGIRNNMGTLEIKEAFGGWTKLT